MAKYVVQPGDTLSKIAKKFGTGIDKISGYRSGNKDLIYAGEEVEVPEAPDTNTTSQRAEEMGNQFNQGSTESSRPTSTEDYFDQQYGSNREDYRKRLTESRDKKKDAYERLTSFRQDRYDEEFDQRNLGEKKDRISKLDNDIATLKNQRDEAISKARANPGASAATLTGDVNRITDKLNSQIGNLVGERNSVAQEYNSELGEIDSMIDNQASDIAAEYKFYADEEQGAQTMLQTLQQALLDELRYQDQTERQESQFERELAAARQTGGSGRSVNLQSVKDPYTGEVIGAFDPTTGQTTYYGAEGNNGAEGNTGTTPQSSSGIDRGAISTAVSGMVSSNPNATESQLKTMIQNNTNIPSAQKTYYYDEIEKQMKGPGVWGTIQSWFQGSGDSGPGK